jgi:hypothetical protein
MDAGGEKIFAGEEVGRRGKRGEAKKDPMT